MYLMPMTSGRIPVPRAKRISLSGLGCNCRGGHYMSGFGDDGAVVTDIPLQTDLTPPPDSFNGGTTLLLPGVPTGTVDITDAPLQTSLIAPAGVSPLTSALTAGVQTAAQIAAQKAAAAKSSTSFLNRQSIPGVSNKYLLGGLALVAALALGGRR